MYKKCSKCKQEKEIESEFRRDRQKKDGRYPRCRACESTYFRSYDRTPRGRERFERRKQLEAEVIASPEAYKDFVKDYFDGACSITGEKGAGVVLDHFIPLSWGNVGNEVGNLIPLSPSLNRSKRNRSIFDVVADLDKEDKDQFYLEVLPFVARENDMTVEEYTSFYNKMKASRHR